MCGMFCLAYKIVFPAVGNGSVHPLAAQALGFLKRLLTNHFGAKAIFAASSLKAHSSDGKLSQQEVRLAFLSCL